MHLGAKKPRPDLGHIVRLNAKKTKLARLARSARVILIIYATKHEGIWRIGNYVVWRCMHGWWEWSIPEAGYQVVEKDGSFQPGQIQAWAQPLPTTKRGEAASAHVLLLLIDSFVDPLLGFPKNQIAIISFTSSSTPHYSTVSSTSQDTLTFEALHMYSGHVHIQVSST
jgi:hypothetical protein